MGGLSVLAQGLYLTLVQQCAENKLSTLEILQLNSYNTLAPFIIVSVLMGEPEAIVKSQYLTGKAMRKIKQILILLFYFGKNGSLWPVCLSFGYNTLDFFYYFLIQNIFYIFTVFFLFCQFV